MSLAFSQEARVEKSIFQVPLFRQVGKLSILPLHAAVEAGDYRIVELLLKKLPRTNENDKKALGRASARGHEAVLKMLLANVGARGKLCGGALQEASASGHEAVVKILPEAGVDVNTRGGLGGNALHNGIR